MTFISQLLELPSVVSCSLVASWLNMKALISLDSACCNTTERNEWLKLLKCKQLVLETLPCRKSTLLGKFYVWELQKNLKTRQIWVGPSILTANVLSQYLRCTGSMIKTCRIIDVDAGTFIFNTVLALHCRNIQCLQIYGCIVDDSYSNLLSACPGLTELRIECCCVGGNGLWAGKCSLLRVLSIANSFVSDESVVSVILGMSQHIEQLLLGRNRALIDAPLRAAASRYQNLTTLALSNSKVTDATLTQISLSCPQLRSININVCRLLTDEGVTALGRNCWDLRVLWINRNANLTDAALSAIVSSPGCRLKSVDISDCPGLSKAAVVAMVKAKPQIQSYYFGEEAQDTQFVISILDSLPVCMAILVFRGAALADDVYFAIARRYRALQVLKVERSQPSAQGLVAVAKGCLKLRLVQLSSPLDAFGRAMWQDMTPSLTIRSGAFAQEKLLTSAFSNLVWSA